MEIVCRGGKNTGLVWEIPDVFFWLETHIRYCLLGWPWMPSIESAGVLSGLHSGDESMGMTVHLKGERLPGDEGWVGPARPPGPPPAPRRPVFLLWLLFSCSVMFNSSPWTVAHQASLSFTIPCSLIKRLSVESVMPSNHLILCHPLHLLPLIIPSIRVFSNELALHMRWPYYGASVSASVLPVNIQCWLSLGLTTLIQFINKDSVPPFLLTPPGPGSRLLFLKCLQHLLWSSFFHAIARVVLSTKMIYHSFA